MASEMGLVLYYRYMHTGSSSYIVHRENLQGICKNIRSIDDSTFKRVLSVHRGSVLAVDSGLAGEVQSGVERGLLLERP